MDRSQFELVAAPPRLADFETRVDIGRKDYERRLKKLQTELRRIQLAAFLSDTDRRGIVVFEGWDASGKGGIIRRITSVLDPRAAKVWPIGPPDAHERREHYLERFWRRLPDPATLAIFDRSWYGRVLVERVEGLASPAEWQRAYEEINAFERMQLDAGTRIVKIFLHVSADEQLSRFVDRVEEPLKNWKITWDDMRNRARRGDYEAAIEEMLARTSTVDAPWHVIAGDSKKHGRVAALELIVEDLRDGFDLTPPQVDEKLHEAVLDAAKREFGKR
jgi:polyphosphate kinase 2 (PPK2 family)